MERVNQRTNHLLGTNIRKLRMERNLRNKDVVAQLQLRNVEISTGTYSKVELGFNNPTVDMLIALTDIFHCDYNAFFSNSIFACFLCANSQCTNTPFIHMNNP